VLDPLNGYLIVGEFMMNGKKIAQSYNFGPGEDSKLTVERMANIACGFWENNKGFLIKQDKNFSAESKLLWLSAELAKQDLGWKNILDAENAIKWSIDWQRLSELTSPLNALDNQIRDFYQERI
jgi:nucleoside-diphosphate-sugar epimerase